jgi:hypothetical protein
MKFWLVETKTGGMNMQAFEMTGETVKSVMNALFKSEAFDDFFVRGVEICSITRFEISGILDPSCAEGEGRGYCYWREVKRYVYDLIRGRKKPKLLRIIFSLPEEAAQAIHTNAAALFLNLNFSEGTLLFTAATSQKEFSLDKTMDFRWEAYIQNFFHIHGWTVSTHN